MSHVIDTPVSATTYTANFKTQYQLTTVPAPGIGGSVTPTAWYDSGTMAQVSATANTNYV